MGHMMVTRPGKHTVKAIEAMAQSIYSGFIQLENGGDFP